ncbi:MAG: hypothetical protein HY897_14125 [Deltaproteobacteria bacterium]|nr:hypothetical protein [Deltaproteobacteria bacterium]
MRYALLAFSVLFLYAGLQNVRRGDAEDGTPGRRLPVPRRLLGFVELFFAVILGGLALSLFTAQA